MLCLASFALFACSGGGSGQPPASPVGSPPPPVPPPPPAPVPVPLPGEGFPENPESQPKMCPDGFSTDAAVNTAVSMTFDQRLDESTVSQDSMTLYCSDSPIDGVISSIGTRLFFSPNADLDPDSACSVYIHAGLTYEDGTPVDEQTWTFDTGTARRSEWRFSEPRPFAGRSHNVMHNLYADGRLIIAHRFAGRLYITISEDQGETLVRSQPIDVFADPVGSVIHDMDMVYKNGVLYIAYRLSGWTGLPESYFVRSLTSDLLTYSMPKYLPPIAARSASSVSSLAVLDDGTIYRARYEYCDMDAMQAECSFDVPGSYLEMLDAEGNVQLLERIGDQNFNTPQLHGQGNSLYVAITYVEQPGESIRELMLDVYNYTAGMRLIGQLADSGARIDAVNMSRLDSDRIALSWARSDRAKELHNVYIAYLDVQTQTISDEVLMSSTSTARAPMSTSLSSTRCSVTNVNQFGTVSLLTGYSPDLSAPGTRGIHLSDTEGKSFHTSIWFEDLGNSYQRKIPDTPFDELCGTFEYDQTGNIHAIWGRRYWTSATGWEPFLVTSNGRQVQPCSRPTWVYEAQAIANPDM
jgi:Big-like domain-containing protein